MPIDLLAALSRFSNVGDQETEIAFLRTHVPWVAPEAYLHIVYKPAPHAALLHLQPRLRMYFFELPGKTKRCTSFLGCP